MHIKDIDFKKIGKACFIGIGGIGISALAKMLSNEGIKVVGINDEDTPHTLDPLKKEGIEIIFQKDLKELPEADLYVYSDAWLYRGPEIIKNAKETNKWVLSYFETLGQIAKNYKTIAVSGTHGKTTTTAMIAEIMIDAGLDPTVIVGSFTKKFGSNFRKGKSKYFLVEADEYNRHFLNFYPYIGVITNIDKDHLDYYKDIDEIKEAFAKFSSQSEYIITEKEEYIKKVPKLLVSGEYNRRNGAIALQVAEVLGIKEEISKKSLAKFFGTSRRLEKIAETKEGTIIYDDYAHHPTEIMATIQALREIYPQDKKKITIIFQPHLYSRTKALFDDFTKCFTGADFVIILPIYFAREKKDETVSIEKMAEEITQNGQECKSFNDFEHAEAFLREIKYSKNDVFVTMGAGQAYKIANSIFNLN
ncbi:MAG: cyanophycin synthetase [Candidatus Paceibacterota bacterium]